MAGRWTFALLARKGADIRSGDLIGIFIASGWIDPGLVLLPEGNTIGLR